MKDIILKNINGEDVDDLLMKVETSFNIRFVDKELYYIKTFGELCDHIANKIQLLDIHDCTTQQAFYKLRNAISKAIQIDSKTISPENDVVYFLPRKNRRSRIKKLEEYLGFKLNILRPPHWVIHSLVVLFLASLLGLYFDWKMGLFGIVSSLSGIWLANKFGNELDVKTVGDLAERMTRDNYINSRRNPSTYNKHEIEKILTEWFSEYFDIDKTKLSRDAKFA